MKSLTRRIVLLVAMAAVAPLLLYGLVSVTWLRTALRDSAVSSNLLAAQGAAEQIRFYVRSNLRVLESVAADLEDTGISRAEQDRILKNHVLRIEEFREITYFDHDGLMLATSRVGPPRVLPPAPEALFSSGLHLAPLAVDDDSLPTMTAAVRVVRRGTAIGHLVGELNLVGLWHLVDGIRVGRQGFALVVDSDGRLIAHKDKRRIARQDSLADHPLVRGAGVAAPPDSTVVDDGRTLAVRAPIPELGWLVILEQPRAEAFAFARSQEVQLTFAIALALMVTITLGSLWGRGFIRRIGALIAGTRALAEGRLRERVSLRGEDELSQLAGAFNTMADRLVELQDAARKQERTAVFGRVAAGLVHDLSHPVQNISNSCRLIIKMADDPDYRQTFRRTVEREVSTIKRMLEDLRNLASPMPLERFPLDANRAVTEVVDSMRHLADGAGVTLELALEPQPTYIQGDLFGLGRVLRNLMTNAFQATGPGGRVTVSTARDNAHLRIAVQDTGCGIPPERLRAIFEDFITTKRRGLGLGLAISRKIVEQLDGRISVESEPGKGSRFVIEFAAMPPPSSRQQPPQMPAA